MARFGVFKVATLMVASGSLAVASLGYLYGSTGALYTGLAVIGFLVLGGQQNSPAIRIYIGLRATVSAANQKCGSRVAICRRPADHRRAAALGERAHPTIVRFDSNSDLAIRRRVHGGRTATAKTGRAVQLLITRSGRVIRAVPVIRAGRLLIESAYREASPA